MRIGRSLLALGAAAALALGAAGCSQGTEAPSGSSDSVSMSVNEAQGEASQAIVLHVKDGTALFAGKDDGGVYFPGIPEGKLVGLNGEAITVDQLKPGNIVEVVGNGIMLESYPGQYPGITLVTVVEEGTEANIDPYRDVIDQVFAEEDPYTVASAHLTYETPQAAVNVVLPAVSWEWDNADGFRTVQDGSPFDANGVLMPNVPDARIGATLRATIGVSKDAIQPDVIAQPLTANADGTYSLTDPSAEPKSVAIDAVDDDEFQITVEPGNLYTFSAAFDNGSAVYLFYTV